MLYQIIHTFEGFLNDPQLDGMTVLLGRNEEACSGNHVDSLLYERLKKLKDSGIDGLVINVGGIGYLESIEGWSLFIKGLERAVDMGFKIWIYDEKGYPSGSAGGLTLRSNPEYEARGIKHAVIQAEKGSVEYCFKEKGDIGIIRCDLVYKPATQKSKSIVKSTHEELIGQWQSKRCVTVCEENLLEMYLYFSAALYEGAHASRSYAEKRRYINLLNSRAVKRFIEVTYDLYAAKTPGHLFKHVEAFFTDEPSFMSVVLPELDGKMVDSVPVLDEVDSEVPLLPSVPYSPELECEISSLYGLSLDEIIPEIFEKNEKPSFSKCAFWEAVAHVYERAFAMQMEEACEKYGKSLTGHVISEESPFRNTIFHSNPFRVLKHFHLPGVDLLSNRVDNIDVFAHKLPFSCTFLKGKTGFMSETSDFAEQRFDGKKPVSPQTMAAALSKQYLLGVREFSYYYDFRARSVEDYREANNIIRRACEYGKSFEFNPEIAVYCPYETFWSGYFPTSLELNDILGEQVSYIKDAEANITALCSELFDRNVQFVLVDESSVRELIERGVKSVVIPKCKVVSKILEEAALEGKLELYGFQPDYVYEKGSLKKPDKHLVIRDSSLIKGRQVPFSFSGRILFSTFKDGRYYLFNDNGSQAYIKADTVLETYNPYTDKTEVREKGGQISILPGQGIFFLSID